DPAAVAASRCFALDPHARGCGGPRPRASDEPSRGGRAPVGSVGERWRDPAVRLLGGRTSGVRSAARTGGTGRGARSRGGGLRTVVRSALVLLARGGVGWLCAVPPTGGEPGGVAGLDRFGAVPHARQ